MGPNRLHVLVACAAMFLLISCGQSPQPPTVVSANTSTDNAPSQAAQSVTGKTAFFEMYKTARTWSRDLLPLTLQSKPMPGTTIDSGNAVLWSATFASPSQHQSRTFTYCAIAKPPEHYKGVSVGNSVPWGGPTSDALPFDTYEVSVDSDAAFKTASADAAAWLKKNPGKEVSVALGNAAQFRQPVWLFLWGDRKSGYAVYVSAKTGAVVKK
ncbi:MAG TPA: hypothetical protein VE783_02865 [Candidatus Limnocylindrales bacterium]|jgi:hypothetical protein|nr:hypothetical protein [Candidatus Limnocylindrales bacterium]